MSDDLQIYPDEERGHIAYRQTEHCPACPFKGCDGCAYQGGMTTASLSHPRVPVEDMRAIR